VALNIPICPFQLDDLVAALWDDAGLTGNDKLCFEGLKEQLVKHPGVVEGLAER
jgi:hypothetical protein